MCSALQAATGEDVSAEELGGAELHCTTSGELVYASSFPVAFFYATEMILGLNKTRHDAALLLLSLLLLLLLMLLQLRLQLYCYGKGRQHYLL